jgi:uncharacterized protein (TIRG00374 family)
MLKFPRRLFWQFCELGRSKIAISSTRNNWKRILPGLVISVIAIAVILSMLDFKKFIQVLLQADVRFLLLGACSTLLWLVIRGNVWRTLLQNKASYRDSFLTVNEGYLLNNILPFRLGEIARAFLMSRKANLDFWQVIPSIIIERSLDLAIAAGLFLSTLPFVIGVPWAKQAAIGIGIIVTTGLGLFYVLAHNREHALAWVARMGEHYPMVKKLAGRRVIAFFDGLAILTDTKLFIKALGWEGLDWLVGILQYYLFICAFIPHPNLLWAVFTIGVGALGVALPSSPGALGVYEAALVGALAVFGLEVSATIAFALSMHIIGYVLTGLIGGYGLYKDGESLSSIYAQLRKMKTEEET